MTSIGNIFHGGGIPRHLAPGRAKFHIGPILHPLAVTYMHVEQSRCVDAVAGRTPKIFGVPGTPIPYKICTRGVGMWCILLNLAFTGGPCGGRVHQTGEMFMSYYRPVFFNLFIGMEPFAAFRLPVEPMWNTRVCSIPDRQKQHFLYLVSCTKKHRLLQV